MRLGGAVDKPGASRIDRVQPPAAEEIREPLVESRVAFQGPSVSIQAAARIGMSPTIERTRNGSFEPSGRSSWS